MAFPNVNDLPEASIGVRATWWASTGGGREGGRVWAFAASPDHIYVGGAFNRVQPISGAEQTRQYICRVSKPSLELDASWVHQMGPAGTGASDSGIVYDLAIDNTNGRLFAVGQFTTADGNSRDGVAVFDLSTGALLDHFDGVSINGLVRSCAVVGSSLYIGGSFTTIDGSTRNRMAKYSITSGAATLDSTFTPNCSGNVRTMRYGIGSDAVPRIFFGWDNQFQNMNGTGCHFGSIHANTGATQWLRTLGTGGPESTSLDDLACHDGHELVRFGMAGNLPTGNTEHGFTYGGTAFHTYSANGDCQAVGSYRDHYLFGHHDAGCAAVRDNTNITQTSIGFCTYDQDYILESWRPRFQQNGSDAFGGGVLKMWALDEDSYSGYVCAGGDFTRVQNTGGSASVDARRVAFFKDNDFEEPPPPPVYVSLAGDVGIIEDTSLGGGAAAGTVFDAIRPWGGGGVNDISQDPNDTQIWYGGYDVGSIVVSHDGGETADPMRKGLFEEIDRKVAGVLAYDDPSNPGNTMVLGAFGARTTGVIARWSAATGFWDHGSTTPNFSGQDAVAPLPGDPRSAGRLIAFDPTGGGDGYSYFCGYDDGLYRSSNGGATVSRIAFAPGGSPHYLRSIAIWPHDLTKAMVGVYGGVAGTQGQGLYRVDSIRTAGVDSAATVNVTSGSGINQVEEIIFLGTTCYIACGNFGVFWADTPYTTWRNMNMPTAGRWYTLDGYVDGSTHTVVAGSNLPAIVSTNKYGSLYKCSNAHVTSPQWEYVSDPGDSNFSGGDLNVFDITTGERYWRSLSAAQGGQAAKVLGRDQADVYAVRWDRGSTPGPTARWLTFGANGIAWISEDNASSWQTAQAGYVIGSSRGIALDRWRPGTGQFGNQDHDSFTMYSYGATMTRTSFSGVTIGHAPACGPLSGRHWMGFNDDATNTGSIAYAFDNLTISTHEGWTTTSSQPGGSARTMGMLVLNNGGNERVLAIREGASNGMFYSDNKGSSWSQGTGFPGFTTANNARAAVWDIIQPSENSGTVFAIHKQDSTIYRSGNYGQSWTLMETISLPEIRQGWLASNDPNILYYSEGDGDLHRIRNATTATPGSGNRDVISFAGGAVRAITFEEDGNRLAVCVVPTTQSERAQLIIIENPPTSGTSMTGVDHCDPAGGGVTDIGQDYLAVGVMGMKFRWGRIFVSVASSCYVRATLAT